MNENFLSYSQVSDPSLCNIRSDGYATSNSNLNESLLSKILFNFITNELCCEGYQCVLYRVVDWSVVEARKCANNRQLSIRTS